LPAAAGDAPVPPAGSGVLPKSRLRLYSVRGIAKQCLPSVGMRGCLGFLVFAAILVTALAVALVQLALPAVVTAAVEGSPLVRGQPVAVTVETSLGGVLLHGEIDSVRITGANLSEPPATIGDLDVTLSHVSMVDRTFASADGTLVGVVMDPTAAAPIELPTVWIGGSSSALTATVALDAQQTVALLEARLKAAGAPADARVALIPGGIDLSVLGHSVPARIETTAETVQLVSEQAGLDVTLLEAPAGGPWQIGDLQVTPGGMQMTLDLEVS
jgi:hypothetical protein